MFNSDKDNIREIKKTYNIFEIMNLKSQKKNVLIMCYLWFAAGFCFYGLILNIENLGGDLFIDTIVTFGGEAMSEMLSGYLADHFGRIIVLKICGFMGGFGFIAYESLGHELATLKTILVFVSSFGFSGVFNLLFIYTPELFPTSIRSTVTGSVYFISRVGALMVPSVVALIAGSNYVFGMISIIGSILCYYMPETLGEDILDDVPENLHQLSFLSTHKLSKQNSSMMVKTMISDRYFFGDDFKKTALI
jgi:MFS family permease